MKGDILMRKLVFCLLSLFLLFGTSSAQDEFDEEAIFRFEEYVVTAAKKLQKIEEAPAAVTVITDEDIRGSGLNSIPEILMRVAGIDVITVSAFDSQVNVRGFSVPLANKLLVLIDGRSVYEDFLGCIYWEVLPIQLEDIERIEIVKGPGSVMYGANAFSGVINIITKSPEETEGGLVSFTGGQFNHYIGSMIYGGKFKDLGYKVTGGWEQASRFGDRDETSEEIAKGTTQLTYQIDDNSSAALDAGMSDGQGEAFVYNPGILTNFRESHIKANYNYSDFRVQTFFKSGRFELPAETFLLPRELGLQDILADYYTYDLDLQHTIELREIHSLMGGLNYRLFTLSCNYAKEKILNTYAGFLQYEAKPIPSVIFNLGVRIDYQDYTKIKTNLSPRGSLIYTPLKDHTLRFSVGRAFRNPTYIDLFVDASIFDDAIIIIGNEELDPEVITSYELGYQTNPFDRLRVTLDFFYYEMEDFIDTIRDQNWDIGVVTTPNATGKAIGVGGEAELDYMITPWLSGLINYSHQYITDRGGNILNIKVNPRNKLNLGLKATLINSISANIWFHFVGATKKTNLISVLPPEDETVSFDPYVLLNASVTYRLLDDMIEVTVSGQNLLDSSNYNDKLYYHPNADPIPLTVFGNLKVRF